MTARVEEIRARWSRETYGADFEMLAVTHAAEDVAELLAALDAAASRGRRAGLVLAGVAAILEANGCDCECGHDFEGHDDDCERCLACRVDAAFLPAREGEAGR